MALRAILDTLDDVPEAVRGEYKKAKIKKKDGTDLEVFALDLSGVDEHPDVVNLRNAHQRQKDRYSELQDQFNDLKSKMEGLPDDFSPDTIKDLNDEIARLKESNEKDPAAAAKARQQLEQQITSLKKQVDDLKKEKDTAVTSIESELNGVLVGDGLTKALIEAGVDPDLMDGARALLSGMVKVVSEDGKRKTIVETDLGNVPVDRAVKDWAASDAGKRYVAKPKGSDGKGSDARGIEGNPFLSDQTKGIVPNLTKQGQAIKADWPKAVQMMKAAGMTDSQIEKRKPR